MDDYYKWLNKGDPPELVKGSLNALAEELHQLYVDVNDDASRKHHLRLEVAKRKIKKLHAKWNKNPPPGWIPDNDDDEGGSSRTNG